MKLKASISWEGETMVVTMQKNGRPVSPSVAEQYLKNTWPNTEWTIMKHQNGHSTIGKRK